MGQNTVKNSLKSVLLCGVVGWILSLYTLWHRAKVQAGVDLGTSFCNISSKISCDTIALSGWSQIAGLTVSTWGLIYFVIVILLAIRGLGLSTAGNFGRRDARYSLAVAGIGVLSSIGLAILSLTKIGSFCIVCGMVYLITFSLFYFSLKLYAAASLHKKEDGIRHSFIIAAVVLIVSQVLFEPLADYAARQSVSSYQSSLPPEFINQLVNEFKASPQYEIPDQKSAADGPSDAKVTVVEFSDFECPHCAQNHKTLPEALKPFQKDVRIIYKNYPLDSSCNSAGMHVKACFAARAARCVLKAKGLASFKLMQHYLFTERESFSRESTKSEALKIGLSENEYNTCIESPETYQEIKDEIDLGKSLGVDSTPSLYINGRKLTSGLSPEIIGAIISNELQSPQK